MPHARRCQHAMRLAKSSRRQPPQFGWIEFARIYAARLRLPLNQAEQGPLPPPVLESTLISF